MTGIDEFFTVQLTTAALSPVRTWELRPVSWIMWLHDLPPSVRRCYLVNDAMDLLSAVRLSTPIIKIG